MSDPMIVGLFLLIVFAPCLVAYLGGGLAESTSPEGAEGLLLRRRVDSDREPLALQGMLPEAELADKFVIRSFAKGIAQHRFLLRDTDDGVRLHIAELRAAAIAVARLGGVAAARQLALVVAALAASMSAAKDAVVIAARSVYEAAMNTSEWQTWGEAMAELQDDSPPLYFEPLWMRDPEDNAWVPAESQAA